MAKRIIVFVLCSLFVVAIILFTFEHSSYNDKITLVDDESYFDEYYINNDKVYFKCYITLMNNTDEFIEFNILGDFEDEYKIDLIKEKSLIAENNTTNNNIFSLKPSEKREYNVIFTGTFGGKLTKANRSLPKIKFNYKV